MHTRAQDFSDSFANRPLLAESTGSLQGSNRIATAEPDEPAHGEHAAGHTVWASWTAPESGLVSFAIPTSTFDSLLAVYHLGPGEGPDLTRLRQVARDDDSGPDATTLVQFAVQGGYRYEIAVDGYGWRAGTFVLQWEFTPSNTALPVILNTPSDVALRLGDTLTLTVDLQMTDNLEIHWYRNGYLVDGANEPTIVVENLKESDLGRYRLHLNVGNLRVWSAPIEVQINSEGLVSVLARDKILDALSHRLDQFQYSSDPPVVRAHSTTPSALRPMGPTPGVVRGFVGTQIFNTSMGGRDPQEPAHCDVNLGPTYWFAYQAPASGLLTLDTIGSNFDTVLAVYTFNPPLLGYDALNLVICDEDSGGDGLSSWVRLSAEADRTYFVVVGGANNSSGTAHLNYDLRRLGTSEVTPPILGAPPSSQTVAPGSTVAFDAVATSPAPMTVQWLKEDLPLEAATNQTLSLTDVQPAESGSYRAVLANLYGTSTTAVACLAVIPPPPVAWTITPIGLVLTVDSIPGVRYTLEQTPSMDPPLWSPLTPPLTQDAGPLSLTNGSTSLPQGFYRVRAE